MKKNWIAERIRETTDDDAILEIADVVTEKLAGVEEENRTETVHLQELTERLEAVKAHRYEFKGVRTGYSTLDEKMGGFTEGAVILIGGETNNGKSALALNMALLQSQHVPVLYITVEMTIDEMLERVDRMVHTTEGLDISFQKSFDLSYKDLDPLISAEIARRGTRIVYLDYLQYLGRGMDEREVAKMSKSIKRIALTYNITFCVIVSLRKGTSDKSNKRKWFDIETEDLMGTAAIGYDADTVVISSRKDEDNEFDQDHLYVKVLKARNVKLDYNDRIVNLNWDATKISEEWARVVTPFTEVK